MSDIFHLSGASAIKAGDVIPFYSVSNGSSRKISVENLVAYILSVLPPPFNFTSQYAAPNASGFSVQVGQPGENTYLLLTPQAAYAAGTIVLPAGETCVDGQQLLVTTTQLVTALTIDGNGATVNNGPTSLSDGFFHLRFDGVLQSWFRVG